jgi:C_GCAxxG_C_C family probable redox protein
LIVQDIPHIEQTLSRSCKTVRAGATIERMAEIDVAAIARAYFLDERNQFGCAEATFIVLKGAYALGDPMDAGAAMALNGGIAYSGGACGAITGAALAVGMLAERRIDDHREAKRVARDLVAGLMDDFRAEHGALDCRDLTGYDLRAPGQHDAFMAAGVWRERCMRQVEFAVTRMAPLADEEAWAAAVRKLGGAAS